MIGFIDTVLTPGWWLMADWSLRWAILILLLAAWLRLRPPRRSATRHLLCLAVLAAGLLLPLTPRWGPGWRLQAPAAIAGSQGEAQAALPTLPSHVRDAVSAPEKQRSLPANPPEPAGVPDMLNTRSNQPNAIEQLGVTRLFVGSAAVAWAVVVVIQLLRNAGACWLLSRIARQAVPAQGEARAIFDLCCRRLRLTRAVRFGSHHAVSSPLALGPWRPAVLVPADWSQLPPHLQQAALMHELAHLTRRDDWVALLAQGVRAAFFFHPLVHWLLRRLARERELVCDEIALAAGIAPREYARMLLDFARRGGRLMAGYAVAMGAPNTVKFRVLRLLDSNLRPAMSPLPRRRAMLVVVVSVAVGCFLGSVRIQTSAASDPEPVVIMPPSPSAGTAAAKEPRVLATIGDARFTHWSSITAVAYSPDGKVLASASTDHTAVIWDAATGERRHTFSHLARVLDLAFSPDGRTLATATSATDIATSNVTVDEVTLWDVATGMEKATLRSIDTKITNGRQFARQLAFSPDGRKLATAGMGQIKFWDMITNQELLSLEAHVEQDAQGTISVTFGIQDIAFSPDGRMLASASVWRPGGVEGQGPMEGIVKLWDTVTGEEMTRFDGLGRSVQSVEFAPDGKTLFGGSGEHLIRAWDLEKRRLRRELTGHESVVDDLAIASDGRTLVSSSYDSTVRFWDWRSGKEERVLRGVSGPLSFDPTGTRLAVTRQRARLCFWDTDTGREIDAAGLPTDSPGVVAYSGDGKRLALGDRSGSISVWDSLGNRRLSFLKGHSSWVRSLVFRSDGNLVSRGDDKKVKVWDIATGELLHEIADHAKTDGEGTFYFPGRAQLSPDGKVIAALLDRGVIELQDVTTGAALRTLNAGAQHVGNILFSDDGKTLAVQQHDTVSLWDLSKGERIATLSGGHAATAFSPDGRTLAAGVLVREGRGPAKGIAVAIWDVAKRQERSRLTGPQGWFITALAFRPDGRTLASTAEDGMVWFWDAEKGALITTLTLGPAGGRVYQVAFSPDGRQLAVISGNGTVSIIDVTSVTLRD